MLIHDDIFEWRGWGGKLKLGSGQCRLRIYDLKKDAGQKLTPLRPYIVIVSDIEAAGDITVRGWSGHIATSVTQRFDIDPQRMMYVEYSPSSTYGEKRKKMIPERYEAVEFDWREGQAIYPRWRELMPPILNRIVKLIGA
jgi:hypothetical protein